MTNENQSVVRDCAACGAPNRVPGHRLADTGRCGKCKAALPPIAQPVDASPELFAAVVAQAKVPVLIDFWAAWCGPCRAAAPGVKSVAESMAGKAIVLKVDTDRHPELAQRYKVTGIPNFVVLKDGRVVSQQAGLVGASELQRRLEAAQSA